MTNILPESRQALEDAYTAEDPWHTRKIPEKRVRYDALLRLAADWELPSCLEISAGEGDFAEKLRAFVPRVEATDIAQTAVARATARYPRVSFFQADAREIAPDVFRRHSLLVWLDSLYWLTREETRAVLRRARDAGMTHFLFSVRVAPKTAEHYWEGHDYETPADFDALARSIFPGADCVPVQLHLWMRPLGAQSLRAKTGCLFFRVLNKIGLYRLALVLTRAAYPRPYWRAFVEPWIIHMAARVEPAAERMRRLLPLTEDITDYRFNRPLAAKIVLWLTPTPVTPNQVTGFSFALGLAAVAALWTGADLLAAALLIASIIVDCVDGQLARAKNMTSEWGDVFDHTSDDVAFVLTSAAVAHRLAETLSPAAVAALCGSAFVVALMLTVSQYVFSHEAAGLIKNGRRGRLAEDRARVRASYTRRAWTPAQAPGKTLLAYFRFRLWFIDAVARALHPRSFASPAPSPADAEAAWRTVRAAVPALKAWRLAGISSVSAMLALFLAFGAVGIFPAVFLAGGLIHFVISKGLSRHVSLV